MANVQLAANLRKLRKEHHYTQEQLGEMLHITHQAYSNYETGVRDPNIHILTKLSEIYNVPLELLITDSCSSNSLSLNETKNYSCIRIENSENEILLNRKETNLILKYRSVSDDDRKLVDKILALK